LPCMSWEKMVLIKIQLRIFSALQGLSAHA
jgi:hypothetical protein